LIYAGTWNSNPMPEIIHFQERSMPITSAELASRNISTELRQAAGSGEIQSLTQIARSLEGNG
jgi:hypothetical protein